MKAIIVTGGGSDYGAIHFEDAHKGTDVSTIINDITVYQADEDSDEYWELEIREVGGVSPEFLGFVRNFIDEDHSKHSSFYLENEVV